MIFGAGWVAFFLGVVFAGVVCVGDFSGVLAAVLVFAPAVRANSEANATVAMALSCVARQVSREIRRIPWSRANRGEGDGLLMGHNMARAALRADQEPLKSLLQPIWDIGRRRADGAKPASQAVSPPG